MYLQSEICALTTIRGNRGCPTSLHQTRTSTSWVMFDPSSFLTITTMLWICCISSLDLSASEICGDMFPVDDTVYTGDPILQNKRQQSDTIQNWSVSVTRGRREKLTWCERESWTWRYLQSRILFKPVESMIYSLRLLSMHLLQQEQTIPSVYYQILWIG